MGGKDICSVCRKEQEYHTETIPVYRKPDEPGRYFICRDCLKKAYAQGNYYKRVEVRT